MTIPHLYVIAARDLFTTDAAWLGTLARFSAGFRALPRVAVALQVRIEAHHASPRRLASQALEIVRAEQATERLPLFLNAAAADAVALGYDGVHWPERRIPRTRSRLALARAASVHSRPALRRAEQAGAEFAVFGSVWASGWKRTTAVGVAALHDVASASSIPVLAIGAVTPERVADCLAAGATGVAVASAVLRARSPAAALELFARALDTGLDEPPSRGAARATNE